MIAFDFVGQLGGRSRWAIAREAAEEEVTPFRSSYLLARFIDCSSSSRLFLEVENNCVKKERVVNTNGKTHLLLTRCLALLFCTVKILLSKSNETDELTYQIKKFSFQKLISQNASLPRPFGPRSNCFLKNLG